MFVGLNVNGTGGRMMMMDEICGSQRHLRMMVLHDAVDLMKSSSSWKSQRRIIARTQQTLRQTTRQTTTSRLLSLFCIGATAFVFHGLPVPDTSSAILSVHALHAENA
eukprot:scaffold1068_cov167-Amphora_coffeaeformis.AAC.31